MLVNYFQYNRRFHAGGDHCNELMPNKDELRPHAYGFISTRTINITNFGDEFCFQCHNMLAVETVF